MVKCVGKGNEAFLSFCDRDVFGTRIKAYFNCYSTDYDFVKFWVQTNENGEVTAAISRVDGDMTLCEYGADYEELLQFVKIVGFTTIQCRRETAKHFTAEEVLWGYVVRFCERIRVQCTIMLHIAFQHRFFAYRHVRGHDGMAAWGEHAF